jgi:putative sterol carrier protein
VKELTEAKTPKEFFENVLPSRFKPDKAADIDVTVQIKITGSNGGDWVVTIKNQQLEVKEGTHPSPTLTLEMSEADYMDLVNGNMSGEKAFLTGKLRFKGNIALALKLRETGFL